MKSKMFQLKVTLRYTKPPIWRRLEVQGNTTLGRLHDILQVAMGWTDSHLHQFVAKGKCYGVPNPEFGLDQEDENKVRLDQVLRKPKDKMIYEYDFGDGWAHEVVVEKVASIDSEKQPYPKVTAGRRACPPEDCGGIPGYYRLLDGIGNPDHPEHEELMEWTGGEFEPERFDIQEANAILQGG